MRSNTKGWAGAAVSSSSSTTSSVSILPGVEHIDLDEDKPL